MGNLTLNGATSGQITLAPTAVAGTNTLTLPASTGTLVTSESASISGNLTFTGTGNRITGDMSNATVANRVAFQTSTANSSTIVSVIPSGTGIAGQFAAYNNSDPTNSSALVLSSLSTEARVAAGIAGTGTYLPMTFYTGGSERMRIDTSGNVGIGTASPAYPLDISGTGVARINPTTGTNQATLFAQNTGGNFYFAKNNSAGTSYGTDAYASVLWSSGAYPMVMATNGTERMRIDASGNVGIGTSSPGAKLDVNGGRSFFAANSEPYSIYLRYNGSTAGFYIGSPAADVMTFSSSGGTERMRINASGDVLIGNSSSAPNALRYFDIYNTSTTSASDGAIIRLITADVPGTSTSSVDIYKRKNGQFTISQNDTNAAAYMSFSVNGERMRITSSGGVSFGSSGTAYGTSGQVLTSAGNAPPTWSTISSTGRLIRAPQFLTSGTSYTTPAGCNYILIEIVGGGGGGGASTGTQSSGGGGNSIFATKYAAVTPSTAYTYAIGGAGNGGSAGTTNNGTAGGTTSITIGATTYSVSGGGGGGGGGNAGAAGTSGTATNMDFSTAGIAAGRAGGTCLTPFAVNVGGAQVSAANNGISATSFGAGGSGGANGGGGNGYQGCMRIWEYT